MKCEYVIATPALHIVPTPCHALLNVERVGALHLWHVICPDLEVGAVFATFNLYA